MAKKTTGRIIYSIDKQKINIYVIRINFYFNQIHIDSLGGGYIFSDIY